jgi:valyl-tRNA synthetase
MNELAGDLVGMPAADARMKMSDELKAVDAVIEIEDYMHSVGHSERTGVVVEPRLSTQWFVKMDGLAKMAIDNQSNDETKVTFWPERFEGTWQTWMDNIRDWVISRQLWWGHQIPAWYKNKGEENEEIYVGSEAPEGDEWVRDEDVLDTWFSSGLWPFSTMGWPDETADLAKYYPTNTLVTGYDIIFFWVARMMFTGEDFTKKHPFKNVLIHGLARDEQGRKMSKSLGNGIDPMDIIEKYGADALRWFLSTGSTPGQDIRFSYDKLDAAWNFINKIWNVSRYILMNIEDNTKAEIPSDLTLADKWILSKLNSTIQNVTTNFDKYEFGEAGRSLYNFIWDDFADWYIEMSKVALNGDDENRKTAVQQILLYTLDQTLRLLHPIMPFVSEEIWQTIPHSGESLMIADYPVYRDELNDGDAVKSLESLIELIVAVRNIRAQANAGMSTEIDLLVKTSDTSLATIYRENEDYIKRFTNFKNLEISADVVAPELSMSQVISGAEIYVPLAELIDIDEEIVRLEGDLAKYEGEVKRVNGKLGNEKFVNSAPAEVVDGERAKLADWQSKLEATKDRIEQLKSAK